VVQVVERPEAASWVFLPPTSKELEEWLAPKRKDAIARIAMAVGKAPDNEIQLAADIHQACCETSSFLVTLEGSKAQKRLDKVKRIARALKKQAELISCDPYLEATVNQGRTPFEIPIIPQLLLKLCNLEESLEVLAKQWRAKADVPENLRRRRLDRPNQLDRPSQLEWLTGVSLPLVYERHFGRRAGRSRSREKKPGGPAVRFIEAVLGELGLKYTRESIIRAFTRLTAQRDQVRERLGPGRI
jgi:hypothetical protein